METYTYEGKNYEELLEKALKELKATEEELIITKEEKKGTLFKSGSIILKITKLSDVEDYIKEYLKELLDDMGIKTRFESKIRNTQIQIKMYSDNNAILIGKNGQTLEALKNIIKAVVHNKLNYYPMLLLDVENYKEKQERNIERLAKNVAREVLSTKVPAKLDSMNSYERRIVHSTLSNFKGIITESDGEEPNRYVIIKPED